jgi:hypothetical protein
VLPFLLWKSNMYYTFGVCVCRLMCKHAMLRIILSSVAFPAGKNHISPHYLTKDTIFLEKKLFNKKCFFHYFLPTWSNIFLTLKRIQRDILMYVYWSSRKEPVILVRFE